MIYTFLWYFLLILLPAFFFRGKIVLIFKRIWYRIYPRALFTPIERELVLYYQKNQFENFKNHFYKHKINPNVSDYVYFK